MKRIFSISIAIVLLFGAAMAQSGGTSFDQKLERMAEKVERLSDKLAEKSASTAETWEARAARIESRAERLGERIEEKWNQEWSGRVGDFGHAIEPATCPETAYLGIETHAVSLEKAKKLGFENRYGSYVSKVLAKSAGASAGLQPFDYIYGVNEQRTSDNQSLSDILEDHEPGDEITLHFVRKGEKMSAQLTIEEDAGYNYRESDEDLQPFLGISPTEDDHDENLDGVSVDVVEKSTAEEMGLKEGDVITSINGFPVLDWDDVTTAVQNTKPGQTIEVKFLRAEQELSGKGTIKSFKDLYPDGDQGNWNPDIDWDEMEQVEIAGGDDWEQEEEQDENRAFIGIFTEMITREKARKLGLDNPYGTYVSGVIPNSGADKAGLKPFDYIFGFDEYRVGEEQHLGIIMKKYKPGEKATVHFIRKGKKQAVPLTFSKPFKAEKKELNSCEDSFFGIIKVGNDNEQDLAISPVKGSTAAELQLKENDVLTHINGYRLVDWQDVTIAIEMLKPGDAINVEYLREGKPMKASKPIKSLAETKNCANCDCGDKESVVIAISPRNSDWSMREKSPNAIVSPTPRFNLKNIAVMLGNVSQEESVALRSKGVQLSEANSLKVENLNLSPNAATGMFGLEFNLPTTGNTLVKIYNLTGRVLYEYDLGSFNGKFSDDVDISQNGPGDYFLEISQSGKVFSKKISLSKD